MTGDLSGHAVMAIEWTLFSLAYIMVGLRIGVRLARRQQKQVFVSDMFLVASAIDCLGLITCDTWTYALGGMRLAVDDTTPSPSNAANEVLLDKISFTSNYFYDTGMYFPKATLLALYFKLFPVTMPRLRKMLYVVTGYALVSAITTCFLDTFWCHNIPDNWSLEEGACSAFNSIQVFQIDWALNFSSDILIFALPFPLLRHIKLDSKQRFGLWLTFGLGLITMGVSLGRFVSIQDGDGWNSVYVWSMAEMAVAIIVVSLPALKVLLVQRLNSKFLSRTRSDGNYTIGSRFKVSARKGSRKTNTLTNKTGDEIELNPKMDVIYKTKEVSIESQSVLGAEGNAPAQVWSSDNFKY